jgi:periplasmic mercuric ion binding protein
LHSSAVRRIYFECDPKKSIIKTTKMKNTIIIMILLVTGVTTAFIKPPTKATASFKVHGTCEMCKERIEKALDVQGVKKAVWEPETETVTVSYNPRKLEEIQLHNLCAIAGHDTEKVKASEQAYADLPECCMYRSGAKCTEH